MESLMMKVVRTRLMDAGKQSTSRWSFSQSCIFTLGSSAQRSAPKPILNLAIRENKCLTGKMVEQDFEMVAAVLAKIYRFELFMKIFCSFSMAAVVTPHQWAFYQLLYLTHTIKSTSVNEIHRFHQFVS
jgi:hypothetical protein